MTYSAEPFKHSHSVEPNASIFYHVTLYRKDGSVGYICCTLFQLRHQFNRGRLQFTPDAPNQQGAWPCQWFE